MPTRSLTVASVARLKPPKEGQVDYFDRGYPGLCLRVSYGGAKAWVYFYRLHGKLRRLSLGRFPGMELDEAHDAWRAARLAVSKGESPAHIKPTAADTFAATAEEWLQRDQAKNRSANEVRRAIEHDVMPAWGERLIAMITRRDVLELIDAVADRGALTMARRLHSHLHRLFRWAVGRGILEVNPMADLPKPGAAVKRDRVLSDGELRAVWKGRENRLAVWSGHSAADPDCRPARRDRRAGLVGNPRRRDSDSRRAQQDRRAPDHSAVIRRARVDPGSAPRRGVRVQRQRQWPGWLVEGQAGNRHHCSGNERRSAGALAAARH